VRSSGVRSEAWWQNPHRPAHALPSGEWDRSTIAWREGAAEPLRSRFARLRIRAAHRDEWRAELRAEEWLLIEWPKGESEPTKYWLSTLPQNIAFADLIDFAKLRWRIERDYHVIDVNLTGAFLTMQEAGRRMVPQGSGSIIVTSPLYGIVAAPDRVGYCVTKAGVLMMAKVLAVEWAKYGVRLPSRTSRPDMRWLHSPI
jgi:hypothetical protein